MLYNYFIYLPFLQNPYYKSVFESKMESTFIDFTMKELPDPEDFHAQNEQIGEYPIFSILDNQM